MDSIIGTLTLPRPTSLDRWLRSVVTFAALALALVLWVETAVARGDEVSGLAATGAWSLFAPPEAGSPQIVVAAANEPPPASERPGYPGGSLVGLFNRPGLVGGFASGFLGAGLLGVLFGRGLFAGLSGVASYLGLIFQLALLVMLGRLIWTRWRAGYAPDFALSPRQLADPYLRTRSDLLPAVDPIADPEEAADRLPPPTPEAPVKSGPTKVPVPSVHGEYK